MNNSNDPVLKVIDAAKWGDANIHRLLICDGPDATHAIRRIVNDQIEAIRTVYLASKQDPNDEKKSGPVHDDKVCPHCGVLLDHIGSISDGGSIYHCTDCTMVWEINEMGYV